MCPAKSQKKGNNTVVKLLCRNKDTGTKRGRDGDPPGDGEYDGMNGRCVNGEKQCKDTRCNADKRGCS